MTGHTRREALSSSPEDAYTPTCAGVLTQLTNIFRVRTRKMRYGANNRRAMRTARALRARQNRGPRHPTLRASTTMSNSAAPQHAQAPQRKRGKRFSKVVVVGVVCAVPSCHVIARSPSPRTPRRGRRPFGARCGWSCRAPCSWPSPACRRWLRQTSRASAQIPLLRQ